MEEIWKDIEGYEGMYQISNFGNVKVLSRNVNSAIQPCGYRLKKEKILKLNFRNGYKNIQLPLKNGKRKNCAVHRLVCEAFIRKMINGEEVNHIDYDKSNNFLYNLEIVTRQENVNHSLKNMKGVMRVKKPLKTNTSEPYISKRKNRFIVTIKGKGKSFIELKEAIEYRDFKLKEIGVTLYG